MSGEEVNLCYQCEKCTSGCPVLLDMDYSPAQIIHACQLNLREMALNNKSIWLCASCHTCSTRCPQGVDISKVMDTLRIIARREKVKAKIPEVPVFYDNMMHSLRFTGSLYELPVAAVMMIKSGRIMENSRLIQGYILKDRIGILPKFRSVFRVNQIIKRVKKYDKF